MGDKDNYLATLTGFFDLKSSIEDLKKEVNFLRNCVYATKMHKRLAVFKNSLKGKSVALFGTGPSVKCYEPIKDTINFGVNGAIYLKNIEFDYLFVQDYDPQIAPNMLKDIIGYNNSKMSCIKFWGMLDKDNQEISEEYQIPPYLMKEDDFNYRYVVSNKLHEMASDIEFEPFGHMWGTILSALQFILYCNPEHIYIVGNDCSIGNAVNYTKTDIDHSYQIYVWKNFVKKHVDFYYPDIKIHVVNPVGLKGIFDDIYQKSFIEKNEFQLHNTIEVKPRYFSYRAIYELIIRLLNKKVSEVYIYCGGELCNKMLPVLIASGIEVKCIFDRKAKETRYLINGIDVEDFDKYDFNDNNCNNFVIASQAYSLEVHTLITTKFLNLEKKVNIFSMSEE